MKKILLIMVFIAVFSLMPKKALGAITDPVDLFNKTEEAIQSVTSALISVGAFVAIFYIITGGIKYMLAAGNPTKQAEATKTLNSAIIGFALLITAASFFVFFIKLIEYDRFTENFQNAQLNIENTP
uniref:Uncharacterized protein n=1 Tax=candidate division CPR3 bacterium TaxID=2268181 RepID=A0A7C4R5Z6_UNCC3